SVSGGSCAGVAVEKAVELDRRGVEARFAEIVALDRLLDVVEELVDVEVLLLRHLVGDLLEPPVVLVEAAGFLRHDDRLLTFLWVLRAAALFGLAAVRVLAFRSGGGGRSVRTRISPSQK